MQAFETPTSDALNLMMAENYGPFLSRQDLQALISVTILKRHTHRLRDTRQTLSQLYCNKVLDTLDARLTPNEDIT